MLTKLLNINKTELHQPRSVWSTFKNAYLRRRNFKKFWHNLDKSNLSNELIKITNIFVESESYIWTSKFWRHLIINHYKHISNMPASEDPLDVIATTDYAGLTFMDEYSLQKSCENINEKIQLNLNLFKKHRDFSLTKSIHYNLVLLIMYENIKSKKIFNNYSKIEKKLYQKYSPEMEIDDKIITQHMLISLLEYEKIITLTNKTQGSLNVLELGAGYGRTANMVLSLSENAKYVIADLAPAIYFSKKNLKNIFPNKKIASAFEINNKNEMMKAYTNNDILFIFPHQIDLFEKKTFDISVSIGCLNEMEKNQIKRYMQSFEKLSNFLYIKAWENSGLPYSFFKYHSVHKKTDYSIKEGWKEHFKDRCAVPSNVFELGYEF